MTIRNKPFFIAEASISGFVKISHIQVLARNSGACTLKNKGYSQKLPIVPLETHFSTPVDNSVKFLVSVRRGPLGHAK